MCAIVPLVTLDDGRGKGPPLSPTRQIKRFLTPGVPHEAILATGTRQVVLATDFGQIHSEPVPDGSVRFARDLSAILGDRVSREGLLAMFSKNGARALGLNA